MTPAALLRELALIAAVMVGWVSLVLLMLERDRKRMERRAQNDEEVEPLQSSLGAGRTRPALSTKEPPCEAVQEESHAIHPE